MTSDYGRKEYWDARYSRDGSAEEWLQTWAGLRGVLEPAIPKSAAIVVLGCGTSTLAEEMWDEGWRDVVGVDYSAEAVRRMEARATARPGLRYVEGDVRALPLGDGACDVALDKGTLDAVQCGDAPQEAMAAMAAEVARVLRPGGVWICVSMRPPRARPFDGWRVRVERVNKMAATNARAAELLKRALSDPELDDAQRQEMTSNWVYFASR